MRAKFTLILGLLLLTNHLWAQSDSLPYTLYRYRPIIFADIGFTAAPIDINYPFSQDVKQLQFRHNNKIMLGIGASYSWFAFRLGFAVIGNFKPVKHYGKSNYYDLGFRFSIKRFFSEWDFRAYTNYALMNVYKWDSTYSKELPNDTRQKIDVFNVSAKMWYINNKHYKMDAFTGNRGVFNKPTFTWYLGGRLDFYGIANKVGPIIPPMLQDSTYSKTRASVFSAVELGVLPGVGYVTRYKTFQFGIMAGLGPMLQFKSYTIDGTPTVLGAVTLRYDFKMAFGYNVPRCFVMFLFDVDTKSIGYDNLKYNQTFYSMRMQFGYRFNEKIPKKKRKK